MNTGFPLLLKFIDANDRLSIQVHPDNEYAKEHEHGVGKTEMWYIVDAKSERRLFTDLPKAVKACKNS